MKVQEHKEIRCADDATIPRSSQRHGQTVSGYLLCKRLQRTADFAAAQSGYLLGSPDTGSRTSLKRHRDTSPAGSICFNLISARRRFSSLSSEILIPLASNSRMTLAKTKGTFRH